MAKTPQTGRLAAAIAALKADESPNCAIAKTAAGLDPELRAEFLSLCEDRTVPGAVVARAAATLGIDVNANRISHHRRGQCACRRVAS